MTAWDIQRYDLFLLDVDGVLVHDTQPIEGAAEAVRQLQQLGRAIVVTNNSTRSREQHANRLCSLGFQFAKQDIVCSSFAAAEFLRTRYGSVRVWPIGEDGLTCELRSADHRIAETAPHAEWVVAGMDRSLTYEKLAAGLEALNSGAQLLATNEDGTYPTPGGLKPGAGAIVGAFRGMGHAPQHVIGKPERDPYDLARQAAGGRQGKALMIGDRLETDILGGRRVGIDTLLVLSGISNEAEIESTGIEPTWTASSIAALHPNAACPPVAFCGKLEPHHTTEASEGT